MQTAAPPIPISLLPMLPVALRQWAQPLEPALWRLDALDISFKTDNRDRKRIPVGGSAVIVANHPYGIVEGLILAALLDQVRPDWKIMVNSVLASIAETQVSLTFALRR